MKIRKIETMGMVDGPGIRTVIFTNGCPLKCLYCHNPEMQDGNEGANYSPTELIKELEKYKTYYDASGGGVTFSGGEPLLQDELIPILALCKENNIHSALDTSGHFRTKDLASQIIQLADLIILDIKHYDHEEYQKLTGGSISRLLDFIQILNRFNKEVWVRSVIIPSYNDHEKFLKGIAGIIKQINNVTNIELLPYHNLALEKYENLGLNYPLSETPNMDTDVTKKLEIFLKNYLNFS